MVFNTRALPTQTGDQLFVFNLFFATLLSIIVFEVGKWKIKGGGRWNIAVDRWQVAAVIQKVADAVYMLKVFTTEQMFWLCKHNKYLVNKVLMCSAVVIASPVLFSNSVIFQTFFWTLLIYHIE